MSVQLTQNEKKLKHMTKKFCVENGFSKKTTQEYIDFILGHAVSCRVAMERTKPAIERFNDAINNGEVPSEDVMRVLRTEYLVKHENKFNNKLHSQIN